VQDFPEEYPVPVQQKPDPVLMEVFGFHRIQRILRQGRFIPVPGKGEGAPPLGKGGAGLGLPSAEPSAGGRFYGFRGLVSGFNSLS